MDLKEIFKDAAPGAKKLGVVGHPLKHTLSPALQSAGIQALGLNAIYRQIEVPPDGWNDFLTQAKDFPLDGFNITVPYKERLLTDWTESGGDVFFSDEASLSGAVNTVDREETESRSTWGLYNTDGLGFADDLDAEGVDVSGKKMVLLGAGGAARAILSVFERLDPAKVTIVNRTAERAAKLVKEMRKKLKLDEDRLATVSQAADIQKAVSEASLVVNATSAGMKPGETPVDVSVLHDNLILYDLIYHRETELREAARKAGATVIGGLGMLVHQGAKSFQIWFGQKPPVDAMRRAAEEELDKRKSPVK